jgi:hypothetical protein
MTDLRRAAERLFQALDDGWVQRDDLVAITLHQALAQPQTSVANLDVFTGVTFSNPPYGDWIGDVELVKWLIINRSKDYWEHKEKNNG